MEQIPTVAEPRMYRESAFVDSGFIEIISDKRFDVQMKYPFLKMKKCLWNYLRIWMIMI